MKTYSAQYSILLRVREPIEAKGAPITSVLKNCLNGNGAFEIKVEMGEGRAGPRASLGLAIFFGPARPGLCLQPLPARRQINL